MQDMMMFTVPKEIGIVMSVLKRLVLLFRTESSEVTELTILKI